MPAQVAPNIMSAVDCTCLHDMGVEGMAAWFRELGLPQYVPAVQQNGIDGLVMADMLCQGTMASVLSMTQPLHMSKVSAGVMRLNRKRGLGQEGAAAQAADKRPRTAAEEMMDEGEKVVSKSSEHGVLVYARRPNRELECAVCLEAVPNEPSMLRNLACDHFSCKTCLLAALRRNRMCPQCRKPADLPDNPGAAVEDLIMLARLPAAMADALPVHCPRGVVESRRDGQAEWSASSYAVEGGCKAIVLRGELDSHLAVWCVRSPALISLSSSVDILTGVRFAQRVREGPVPAQQARLHAHDAAQGQRRAHRAVLVRARQEPPGGMAGQVRQPAGEDGDQVLRVRQEDGRIRREAEQDRDRRGRQHYQPGCRPGAELSPRCAGA